MNQQNKIHKRRQSSQKIYTEILENISILIIFKKDEFNSLNLTKQKINLTKIKKEACDICRVSVSTYNKYLRDLKNKTYTRCELIDY